MKEKPLEIRKSEDIQYTDQMAKIVSRGSAIRKKTAEQSPHTKFLMTATKEEKEAYYNRDIGDSWKSDKYAMRSISPEEFSLQSKVRDNQRKTEGASEGSSISKERRELAIDSFICSPPADVSKETKERINKIIGLKSEAFQIVEAVKTKTFFQKVKSIFVKDKGTSYEDDNPGAIEAWTKILGGKKND